MNSIPKICGHHNHGDNHGLYVLECKSFADIGPALKLPSKHFVLLFVADFATISRDDLVALTDHLIELGARYFCAWGPECRSAHAGFDAACSRFYDGGDDVIMTTDHHADSLEDAIWYLLNCANPSPGFALDCDATIAILIDQGDHAETVRRAFAAPESFSDNNGPAVDEAE